MAAAFACIGCGALAVMVRGNPVNSHTVFTAVLTLFVVAIRNSWNLVFEHDGLLAAQQVHTL